MIIKSAGAAIFSLLSLTAVAQELKVRDSTQNLNSNFHFQLTTVTQYKFKMQAPYTGANSLTTNDETASTVTATIFWGTKLWKGAALYINPEIAGGKGISSAKGIAGFVNGEAFRVGDPSPKIYPARAFFQQTFNLGGDDEYIGAGVNEVYKTRSKKYINIILGRFSIADYFDTNSYSHDPRSQFFNWGLMSNGGWDYPANVRGYTYGAVLEYGNPNWKIRAASVLVPTTANGNTMDTNYGQANSNVIEFEKPYTLNKRTGTLRLLAFYTNAMMGNYNESIALQPVNPDITATRKYGRNKYGFGVNLEQELSDNVGLFARASWNDGNNETWAFTEIDRSVSMGLSINGSAWKRKNDVLGIGTVINGLSEPHKNYLKSGGYGFIIGDGQLNYGSEWVTELFYNANILSDAFFLTPNIQLAVNPAYNRDRGPAFIIGARAHIAF
ncbi:MAG TPA: carbohydrate porin [Cyclobacteriaceae bacterium]|nr:carbohydrate porin [Cyclobacteriaceae bacterium]